MRVAGTDPSVEQQVQSDLRARGSRMTVPRAAVIRVLQRCEGHLSADEVHSLLDEDTGIHLSTVYRTLDALTELGVVSHVHVSTGSVRYELVGAGVHAHAQCLSCHRLLDLPAEFMDEMKRALLDTEGFALDPGHVALSGTCAACRVDQHRQPGPPAAPRRNATQSQ